jgi:hypothetical protein
VLGGGPHPGAQRDRPDALGAAGLRGLRRAGDAAPRELLVANTSPWTVYKALDGAIAKTVMEILNDRQVLNYLASTPGAGTPVAAAAPASP